MEKLNLKLSLEQNARNIFLHRVKKEGVFQDGDRSGASAEAETNRWWSRTGSMITRWLQNRVVREEGGECGGPLTIKSSRLRHF